MKFDIKLTRYQFDPTGTNPDNLVLDELHVVPVKTNRMLALENGAFYADSVRIFQGHNELVKGVDYEFASLYQDATNITGKEVYVIIHFNNLGVFGEVSVNYQVVGGKYTGIWEAVQEYINVLLVDPRNVRWDDVLNKPRYFTPVEHWHDVNDVYGLNAIVPRLEALRQAVTHCRSRELKPLYDRILKIKNYVEGKVEEIALTSGNLALLEAKDAEHDNNISKLTQALDALKNKVSGIDDKVDNNDDVLDIIKSFNEIDYVLNGTLVKTFDLSKGKLKVTKTSNNITLEQPLIKTDKTTRNGPETLYKLKVDTTLTNGSNTIELATKSDLDNASVKVSKKAKNTVKLEKDGLYVPEPVIPEVDLTEVKGLINQNKGLINNVKNQVVDLDNKETGDKNELVSMINTLTSKFAAIEQRLISMDYQIAVNAVPAGAFCYFALEAIPPGWCVADGRMLNKDDFSRLFNAIGYKYGGDEQAGLFKIPDCRGVFVRNWDPRMNNLDSNDYNREMGSLQLGTLMVNCTNKVFPDIVDSIVYPYKTDELNANYNNHQLCERAGLDSIAYPLLSGITNDNKYAIGNPYRPSESYIENIPNELNGSYHETMGGDFPINGFMRPINVSFAFCIKL